MPIQPYNLHSLARFAADGMLNSLLAGVAIAVLAWAATRLARQQGSATRFTLWFLALIVLALLPWAGAVSTSSRLAAPAVSASVWTLPESFAVYLFVAWLIGVSFGLARICFSLYRLQKLRSTCRPVDLSQLEPSLCASLASVQLRRRVKLCVSDEVRVPAAIGYFRPMVVFPTWALAEIPSAELNAILLHELAHLRRWDDWTNLVQKVVKAVFFFHPAVWFIESYLSLEREMACDDAVLAANFSPRAYAESLVNLAERSFLRRSVQLAQAAVGHVQQLKLRLAQIIRKDRVRQGSGFVAKPVIGLMALAGIVSVYTVSRAPHLIAFSSDTAQSASSGFASTVSSAGAVARLQPVHYNVRNNAFSAVASRSVVTVDPRRPGTVRSLVLRPRVDLTQRLAKYQLPSEEVAPPVLVLSNFSTDSTELVPSPVLVIFQGEQFGIDGPVLWRVTILHLTPSQQRAFAGGLPKQI